MNEINSEKKSIRSIVRKTTIIAGWLAVWQLAAIVIDNTIMLAGPIEVLRALAVDITKREFWKAVFNSYWHIMGGFAAGTLMGLLFGYAASRKKLLAEILKPLVNVVKSVPVAAFVVLLLIWCGSKNIALLVSFLVVWPSVYLATLEGVQSEDALMCEVAKVSQMSAIDRFRYITRPALSAPIRASFAVMLGMCFKSGVAAEVIAMTANSIGDRIYSAKIYIDTKELFAWTFVVVMVGYANEKLVMFALDKYIKHRFVPKGIRVQNFELHDVSLHNISKSFGRPIITDFNYTFEKGKRYYVTSPSGVGKTTLFRIISKLETADAGTMEPGRSTVNITYQEDRLVPNLDAISNILLTAPERTSKESVRKAAMNILPECDLNKPVSEFSGGMKRRVAVLRALFMQGEMLLLDEPFAGMDSDTAKSTAQEIMRMQNGRILVISGHEESLPVIEDVITITLG